jgi:hypothetical protein
MKTYEDVVKSIKGTDEYDNVDFQSQYRLILEKTEKKSPLLLTYKLVPAYMFVLAMLVFGWINTIDRLEVSAESFLITLFVEYQYDEIEDDSDDYGTLFGV